MAKRGHPRTTLPQLPHEDVVAMLSAAITNHDDFVLAWEPRPGEDPVPGTEPKIHVMTGNLVTPCRLNGLIGRAMLYKDEGAQIVTFTGGLVSAPVKKERDRFRNLRDRRPVLQRGLRRYCCPESGR